jgi:hypothetical protein
MKDFQKDGRGAECLRHRLPRPHPVLLRLLDEAENPPAEIVAPPRDAARGTTAGAEVGPRPVPRPPYSQD